jgi:hypothetical protein
LSNRTWCPSYRRRAGRGPIAIYAALAVAVFGAIAARVLVRGQAHLQAYTPDELQRGRVCSSLSPDGRMIAFIVGSDTSFPTTGEIYTKLLPDGEPVQRTRDGWPKCGLTFSPDGSRSRTVADATRSSAGKPSCTWRRLASAPAERGGADGWTGTTRCFRRSNPACIWGS